MKRSTVAGALAVFLSACQPNNGTGNNSSVSDAEVVPPKGAKFIDPATMDRWVSKHSGATPSLAGTENVGLTVGSDGRYYLTPTKAPKLPMKGGGLVDIAKLTDAQILTELSLIVEDVSIEQLDAEGNVTPIFGSVSASKGIYRVVYYYYRYANLPCEAAAPAKGAVGIGIGVKIVAEFNTTKSKINVGIMNLASSAEANHAKGKVTINSIGISSGAAKISSYLSGSSSLSADGLKKAVESLGVVKAIFEVGGLSPQPHYLFIQAPDPNVCPAIGLNGKPNPT